MLPHDRLDLPRLDAETAELHLMVDTTGELDVSVWQVARHIPGPVKTLPGNLAERIGHEPFRRQLGLVEIAPPYAGAADIQLAPDADGHGLP